MRWMTTFLIAFLGVAAVSAQEPTNTVIYDVRDLVPKASSGDRTAAILAGLCKDLKDALEGIELKSLVVDPSGSILIQSDDAGQKRVRDHLARLRRSLLAKWNVVVVTGRNRAAVAPAAGAPPTVDFAPRASLLDAAGKAVELPTDADAPDFVRLAAGRLRVDLPADGSGKEARAIELDAAALASKSMRPNEKDFVELGRLRRFVCGYRVLDSVEGHPAGLTVPEVMEVFDGARVAITLTPSLDGKFATVDCEARFAEIAAPVEAKQTPEGPIRVPNVREREVSARLTIADGAAFLLTVPEGPTPASNVVLIVCTRTR